MCSPQAFMVSLASIQGAVQFAGQQRQAKQQAELQRQSIAFAERKAAMQVTATQLERQQQVEAVAQEKGKVAARGEAAGSRAVVAAGEAGVSGLSVQALMDDYIRQQAGQVAALTSQDKLYALRHGLNLQQLAMASEQEIRGLSKPIEYPSVLGAVIGSAQKAVGAYSTYKDFSFSRRPAAIDTGMGISTYMPGTDQYTLPARGPLAIRGR